MILINHYMLSIILIIFLYLLAPVDQVLLLNLLINYIIYPTDQFNPNLILLIIPKFLFFLLILLLFVPIHYKFLMFLIDLINSQLYFQRLILRLMLLKKIDQLVHLSSLIILNYYFFQLPFQCLYQWRLSTRLKLKNLLLIYLLDLCYNMNRV